jgi:hypothetical protein
MDYKPMAKSFLKAIGASPEQLKAVDMLFETKWVRPRSATNGDVYEFIDNHEGETVRIDGTRKGKSIRILIQTDDPTLVTPELARWLEGIDG